MAEMGLPCSYAILLFYDQHAKNSLFSDMMFFGLAGR